MMENRFAAGALRDMTGLFDELMTALSTLHGLGNLKINQLDEQELLRQALGELIRHYGFEYCSVFFCEEERLVQLASQDWLSCRNGETCSTGKPLAPAEEKLLQRALRTAEIQVLRENLFVVVAVPLRSNTDMLGVLHLCHAEPDLFGEWQHRLLHLFGVFLGQALTASRMLNRLDQEVQLKTRHLQNVLEESRHLEEHFRKLSMLDELTGLHNRRYFFNESRLVLNMVSHHWHPITVMVMDIDRFKRINDTYGHPAGDQVLKSLGWALQKQLRQSDILARVGGEEFAVTLPETDDKGAQELAERLLRAARNLHWADIDAELRISLSVGMVTLRPDQSPRDQDNINAIVLFDQLISCADEGTYIAKSQGGDRAIQVDWRQTS